MKRSLSLWVISVILLGAVPSEAGVPLVNLEGVGGVAFNPLAYPADKDTDPDNGPLKIGYPRIGAWYVNLSDVKVDWTTLGAAETFFDRLEVSYGYETIAQSDQKTKHKHNIGTKLLVIPENLNNQSYVPAVSVGGLWKKTTYQGPDVDDAGVDGYIVATKLVKELPRPLLLSGGVLTTQEKVTGVFGFDEDRDGTFFANADLILTDWLAVGYEYKEGARYRDFKNADYWDVHAAWLVNKEVTIVAAYVNAGNEKSATAVGLGDGVVLSIQYVF